MFDRYHQVQKLNFGFKNELYTGYLGSQKVFIKKYVIREGREREDRLKVETELACYQNITSLSLPKVIEANPDGPYLVLEWLDLSSFPLNKEALAAAFRLWQEELPKIPAHFAPLVDWAYYEGNLFRRARELGELGIIDAPAVITRISHHQAALSQGFTNFSHGDFYPDNFKLHQEQPLLFDFEHAHQDCRFYDLACLKVHFFGEREANLVDGLMADFSAVDRALYEAMQLRRSIDILFAFKNHQEMAGFARAQHLVTVLLRQN